MRGAPHEGMGEIMGRARSSLGPGSHLPQGRRFPAPMSPSPDLAAVALVRAQLIALIRPQAASLASPVDPESDGSWPDLDCLRPSPSVWPGRAHLERALVLAAQGRREAALAALRWWFAHDPLNPNWWHNQIGTPRLIAESLLLLGEAASRETLDAARRQLDRAGEFLLADDGITRRATRWTGANRLWISMNRLLAAVLFADPDGIRSAVTDAMEEVRVSPRDEEGIQVDGSFHQHGPLLYNGGYGKSFLEDCCFFFAATRGTPWQPGSKRQNLLADFLLDGTRWMLRGEAINPGCLDRNISRPRATANGDFAHVAEILAAGDLPRSAELRALAAAVRRRAAPGPLVGNRMFYRSDFMAHHAESAHLSVRMHSARTRRGESINGEGLLSHHVSDGLTWLMRTGAEYRDICPVWDWQKLPGTTCAQTPPPDSWQRRAAPGDAGGVSDGRHGACTQHLVTDTHAIRKSWFFGPGALVCLGAGLHGDHAHIVTTLDQSLVQGPVSHDRSDPPLSPLPPGRHRLASLRRLRHGPWTFTFPRPTDVTVELGPRSGAWSRIGSGPAAPVVHDVFLACIDHGAAPSDGGYAYAVSADASGTGMPTSEIVQNSSDAQAVWWPESGLLQAVFHRAGEIGFGNGRTLDVDRECCAQLRRSADGGWRLDAADIAQSGGMITARLHDPSGTLLAHGSAEAPVGDHAGRTVRVF